MYLIVNKQLSGLLTIHEPLFIGKFQMMFIILLNG